MHNLLSSNSAPLATAGKQVKPPKQVALTALGQASNLNKIVCILGPTGTGKSGLALALAHAFNGAIINLDSRQVYLGLPIVTAQPNSQAKARYPHFLYGFLPCTQKISAGIYADLAHEAISLCLNLGILPILVGGTGLYVQALLQGIAPIPAVPEVVHNYWQMRNQQAGSKKLHAELMGFDPTYGCKINPNDQQRVTRALAVYSATGRPLSWWHAQPMEKPAYSVLKLGLKAPLDELKPRLAKRIEQMLACGVVAELARAVKIYEQAKIPGLSSIGCTEILD